METDFDQTVSTAFCRVVAQLAFMFAEPVKQGELPPAAGACVIVRMDFSGTLGGTTQLAVPSSLCVDLATNMLGTELDCEQAAVKGLDALKEVLNVTCGNILTDLAGTEPVFSLTIPTASPLDLADWEVFQKQPGALSFLIDDYPAALHFQMERQGA